MFKKVLLLSKKSIVVNKTIWVLIWRGWMARFPECLEKHSTSPERTYHEWNTLWRTNKTSTIKDWGILGTAGDTKMNLWVKRFSVNPYMEPYLLFVQLKHLLNNFKKVLTWIRYTYLQLCWIGNTGGEEIWHLS